MKRMGAVEYQGWSAHLLRYPPGDYLAQTILAQIWSLLANAFSAKDSKHSPYDVAPWLEDLDQKRKRQDAEVKAQRAKKSALITEIYEASKQE